MIFLGLIVIRYFFIDHAILTFNIDSLAKPAITNDDFAKGMNFYLISTFNYLSKLANSQR